MQIINYSIQANILFKNFEMENDVDRVLVYVTLYIIECLKRLQKIQNAERATQEMFSAALEPFALPGEAGFPLNAFYTKPNGSEAEDMKKYFVQVGSSKMINAVFAKLRPGQTLALAEAWG